MDHVDGLSRIYKATVNALTMKDSLNGVDAGNGRGINAEVGETALNAAEGG